MNTLYSRRTRFDDTRPRSALIQEALEDWAPANLIYGPVRYVCSNTIADWMDYEDDEDWEYDCYDV